MIAEGQRQTWKFLVQSRIHGPRIECGYFELVKMDLHRLITEHTDKADNGGFLFGAVAVWLCGPDLLHVFFSPCILLLYPIPVLRILSSSLTLFNCFIFVFIALHYCPSSGWCLSCYNYIPLLPRVNPLFPPLLSLNHLSLSLPPSFIYLARYTDVPSSRPP